MKKFIDFMNNRFSPKMNKFTGNAWVSSIQDSVMSLMPLILVGSVITIIGLLTEFFSWIPDFSIINTFTFGLLGLLVSFLIPYFVMEKKQLGNKKIIAGATSLALYLMLLSPVMLDDGNVQFIMSRFGAEGMFLSLVIGLFVGFILVQFSKFSFFSEDTSLPEIIVVWFDSLIPIAVLMLTGWIVGYQANLDFFEIILTIFSPLSTIIQTYPGFVLSIFIPTFLYSFGVSPWAVMPVIYPVYLSGLAENAQIVASGGEASNIALMETKYAFISMGGVGVTLPLAIMMCFMAKAMKNKAIGKATIVPSIFNINEPLMFGSPIVFNPFLMIPMWISAIVIPSIVYFVYTVGLVTIPSNTFLLWYVPMPISSYLATQDWRAIIVAVIIFVIAFIIYYPFFKAYDIQELKKQNSSK